MDGCAGLRRRCGGLAGLGRKQLSRLGFDRGLHGKDSSTTGNSSRARVGETKAGEECTAAACGVATPTRNRARGKVGKRREKGPAMLLTATRSF
jgi:hypothetical protein